MQPSPRSPYVVLLVFSLVGVIFAGISTADFVAHLDRQVHAITCSYVPGLDKPDISGSSGCYAVLMSPYSSVLRTWTWGGIPIALPALSVFAYLLFRGLDLFLRRDERNRTETRFLVAATLLPLLTSGIYYWVSKSLVGEVCKLCVGTYFSSIGVFAAALWAHFTAADTEPEDKPAGSPWGRYLLYFAEGVVFVVLPLLLYLMLKPGYSVALGECGELRHPEDKYGVRIKLNRNSRGVPALEILDPLCPACKHFAERLEASGPTDRLALESVVFPLDKECNWMVSESLHPGACGVSEALLCAGDRAPQVLAWAFAHQEELLAMAEQDPERVTDALRRQFPFVADCIGKPGVRARLNRSLRWSVSNSLPVLAPQLYVRNQKVCDEDTDLGLEYVLTRILEGEAGTRSVERR
ncbi:MAG: vitamin K epoxide reductase family protein [Candidatus Latescibacterota bacterium]